VAAKILVVCGSSRPDGRLEQVVSLAARSARAAGGHVRELWLEELQLPIMIWGDEAQSQRPDVIAIRDHARWADGFVIGTPEYHGNMSGALKNWFDYLYNELAGKLAGVVATTGGGTGDMSITAVKTCFSWCHGFVLPFHAAATPISFDDDVLVDAAIVERVKRLGHDVVRYAPVLRAAFEQAREDPSVAGGFAGLHHND
jgi:FMN reductase